MKAQDNKMGAYYNYDASGERNFKLTGDIIELTQNIRRAGFVLPHNIIIRICNP